MRLNIGTPMILSFICKPRITRSPSPSPSTTTQSAAHSSRTLLAVSIFHRSPDTLQLLESWAHGQHFFEKLGAQPSVTTRREFLGTALHFPNRFTWEGFGSNASGGAKDLSDGGDLQNARETSSGDEMCSVKRDNGLVGLLRWWKKSPQNVTAQQVTSPVSKTPNLTPVVRKEVMVDPPASRELTFEFVGETPAYKGWRSIIRRRIRGPRGKVRSYDVVTQDYPSVLVFTWDTQTNTTTILKEFYPGMKRLMYGVVGGNYEQEKHSSPQQAAACELEEEAHLHKGTWHTLMKSDDTVSSAGKYSTQIFHSYLVVDPVVKGDPRELDDGEFIEYNRGVSLEEVRAMIYAGDMSVTSGFAALMAIEKLRELGLIL